MVHFSSRLKACSPGFVSMSQEYRQSTRLRLLLKPGLARAVLAGVILMVCISTVFVSLLRPARATNSFGSTFASSDAIPLLQFPEGITSWDNRIYVATFNVVSPSDSRIFVFNAATGKLLNTLGGQPGQELISAGALLGLTIDRNTGDLYVAANFAGNILKVHNPENNTPQISVYATYPAGGGPEDLVFGRDGTLFATDSNLGMVYSIPPGGGSITKVIGPAGSGAQVSDNGLFTSPVQGLSPNGIVFSQDWRTLYVANTWSDSVLAFAVDSSGHVTGPGRVFAQNKNDDLEEYPTGFDALVQPDTKFGPSASTPLNGPDGLALDSAGHIWVASVLGDNLTVLDSRGNIVTTFGTSAVTAHGLLNNPAGMTFVGTTVYCSNLGIFTGLAGTPNLPFRIVSFDVGVSGAGGNGNY
jgi:hypothetical protein